MANSVFLFDGVPFTGQMVGPAADNTAAPPFTFLGDLTTGYASSASGTLDLVTAGTSRLAINSTAAAFANGVIGSFTKSAIATTSTTGFSLINATAATAGVPVQMSPRFMLTGTALNSSSGASETDSFFLENLPATVAGATTGTLKCGWKNASAAATYPMTLTSAGELGITRVTVGTTGAFITSAASDFLAFNNNSGVTFGASSNAVSLATATDLNWTNGTAQGGSVDLKLKRNTTSVLQITDGTAATGGWLFDTAAFGNAQKLTFKALSELTTIAAAANTDTAIQMPANSVVLGVSVRVTTVIPTAATFTVGDSGSAARFSTTTVSTAANSTDPGTKAGAYYNASALSIRITPNAQPADNTGRVRVTIYYYSVTPPTS